MAQNFRILIRREKDIIHFELKGDFDGSSAFELYNAISDHSAKAVRIVINTGDISSIHPFGVSVFRQLCSNNRGLHLFKIAGKYRKAIEPQELKLQ